MSDDSIKAYEKGKVLGTGAYGFVLYGRRLSDGLEVAIKIVEKKNLIRSKKTQSAANEKAALDRTHHPNVVSLLSSFQDGLCIYFVFEFLPNGLLSDVLGSIIGRAAVSEVFGQLLLAIAHIHQNGIIHRDLKPENVMLDNENRVRLIDFGSAKLFDAELARNGDFQRGSFVGSVDYMAPEVVNDLPTSTAVDLWAFGCMLFVAFEKRTPFFAETKMITYENIGKGKFAFTEKTPDIAKDLIQKLLVLDYKERLGYGEENDNYSSIRSHPFFDGIDWETLPTKPIKL